jgi:hypothetical protein
MIQSILTIKAPQCPSSSITFLSFVLFRLLNVIAVRVRSHDQIYNKGIPMQYTCLVKLTFLLLFLVPHAQGQVVTSDFAFGSGSPFGGTTTIGGVFVTLSSSRTEPIGGTAFRDIESNATAANVLFTFDTPISEFELDLFAVRNDEFLNNFNIGSPTSVSGTLTEVANGITTSLSFPDDNGAGKIRWTGINTTSVSFDIEAPTGALGIGTFGVSAVPEPTSMMMLTFLTSIGLARRRR